MKLSIIVDTYNHEKYIEECLQGIFKQKINFDCELIIGNDCSNDNTHQIIQDFLSKNQTNINVRYYNNPENKGMVENSIYTLKKATGEYIAYCEGDDYWIDEFKLQKQVDFLNENKSYSSCFTNVNTLLYDGSMIEGVLQERHKTDCDSITIFDDKSIYSLTFMFRKSCLEDPLPEQFNKVYFIDAFMFFMIAQKGNIGYLDFVSSVYRQHTGGSWSGLNRYDKTKIYINSYGLIRDYFKDNKIIYKNLTNRINKSRWEEIYILQRQGNYKQFFLKYLSIIFINPTHAIKNSIDLINKLLDKRRNRQ
jgi:glycosyltransferase involved in cell wall biosynthesis